MAPASASVLFKCVHLCLSVCLSPTCPSFTEAICSVLSSVWISQSSQGRCQEAVGLGREQGLGSWAHLSLRWRGSGYPPHSSALP